MKKISRYFIATMGAAAMCCKLRCKSKIYMRDYLAQFLIHNS